MNGRQAAERARLREVGNRMREKRLARRGSSGERLTLARALVIPLLLFAVGSVAISAHVVRSGRPTLPPLLLPADFEGALQLSDIDRVGTLFRATVADAHDETSREISREELACVIAELELNGYETVLLVAPDGTTLASGPLDSIWVKPAGQSGS